MEKIYDTIIVGGGASGLFAGGAMKNGSNTLILEGTRKPGNKLLLTGAGQCNLTREGNVKNFTPEYGHHGLKLRSCLYRYNNKHLRAFLDEAGVKTFTRADFKIFPVSLDAHEVLDGLLSKCASNGVTIKTECKVTGISKDDSIFTVQSTGGQFKCRNLIIATGGCSYPSTGSDGSIFPVLERDLNLPIVTPKPALVPLNVKDYRFSQFAGMSFPDVTVHIHKYNGKPVSTSGGGLLFTHTNFSGPAILNISRFAEPGYVLTINYVNGYAFTLKHDLIEAINTSKMSLANIISSEFRIPKRFSDYIVTRYKGRINDIVRALSDDTYFIDESVGFERAMVTAGGVDVEAIDFKTMQVKEIPGLYVIGEAVDIDGNTGGYNLQYAYASANAAVVDITSK